MEHEVTFSFTRDFIRNGLKRDYLAKYARALGGYSVIVISLALPVHRIRFLADAADLGPLVPLRAACRYRHLLVGFSQGRRSNPGYLDDPIAKADHHVSFRRFWVFHRDGKREEPL